MWHASTIFEGRDDFFFGCEAASFPDPKKKTYQLQTGQNYLSSKETLDFGYGNPASNDSTGYEYNLQAVINIPSLNPFTPKFKKYVLPTAFQREMYG